MMMTLTQACARLSLTPRQIRYKIKKGELVAKKVDGRWQIDDTPLPKDPAADRAEAERAADLRQTLEDQLSKRRGRRPYTVEDLEVFNALVTLGRALARQWPDHPAKRVAKGALPPWISPAGDAPDPRMAMPQLEEAAVAICRGVHLFEPAEKLRAYHHARFTLAAVVARLHLTPREPRPVEVARGLEDAVLSGLGALIRRHGPGKGAP